MTFAAQLHLLYVCRTCPRYEALPRQGEKTRGMALVEAVRALTAGWAFTDRYQIIGAHCLNGCPVPCNVVLAAQGKTRLRFHRMGAEDAAWILDAAELYYSARDGELAANCLPASLRSRLAASIPALDQSGRPMRHDAARDRE